MPKPPPGDFGKHTPPALIEGQAQRHPQQEPSPQAIAADKAATAYLAAVKAYHEREGKETRDSADNPDGEADRSSKDPEDAQTDQTNQDASRQIDGANSSQDDANQSADQPELNEQGGDGGPEDGSDPGFEIGIEPEDGSDPGTEIGIEIDISDPATSVEITADFSDGPNGRGRRLRPGNRPRRWVLRRLRRPPPRRRRHTCGRRWRRPGGHRSQQRDGNHWRGHCSDPRHRR
jgi:hypothetical protein